MIFFLAGQKSLDKGRDSILKQQNMNQLNRGNDDRKFGVDKRNHGPLKFMNNIDDPEKYHWEQNYTKRKSDTPYFYRNLPPPSMQLPQNYSRPPGVGPRGPVGSPMRPRGPIGMGFGQRGPNPELNFIRQVSYKIQHNV